MEIVFFIIYCLLVIGIIIFAIVPSNMLFNFKSVQDEINERYSQIIIDSINAPRYQRLCEAAGLPQLPAKCKCGFFGKSSDEMEKHLDECEVFMNTIMDRIEYNRKNKT